MSDWVYCLLGIVGGSLLSFIISWFFSGRYNLVADIVTVPSEKSRFSEKADIDNKKGFAAYDTYVVLKNNGNQGLQMSDFAPLNMPHILINGGVLQEREKPYRTLKNPNPFAMYNNVRLSYDGKWTINITFDQLKAGHTIEIVVHSLFPKNQQKRVKLAVGATLKNGNYISKKQLRAIYGMIQIIVTAIGWMVLMAVPVISASARLAITIVMGIWWPVSVWLVDVISYYSAQRKIVRR